MRYKTYWKVFWQIRRAEIMRMMEYRANFAFWFFVSTLWTIFNFFFFAVIVNVSDNLAGWSQTEMYLLLGVFTVIDAFTWSIFYHNMHFYTQSVFSGNLNLLLIRPLDTQFLLLTSHNSYTNIMRFIIGVGSIGWAIKRLGLTPSIGDILLFLILLVTSLCFVYAMWFIFSTLAFWVERLDNINEIIPNLRRAFQVPHQVYTGIFSFLFTVLLPFGLVSSLPSEALLHRVSSWPLALYYIVFTLGLMLFSRAFFFFSLKRYAGIAN